MEPVGNDIVWLGDPCNQGRWLDTRLVGRILTLAEQAVVLGSQEPDRLLWSLWAAKEAGYKAWARTHPGASFSPVSFEVADFWASATVTHRQWTVPVCWLHGADWVHAVAGANQESIITRVERGEGDESQAVRSLAVRALIEAGMLPGTIEGFPPHYLVGGRKTTAAVSLSHDGPYCAVAFRLK